jgi:NitT/TauT family transport system substrate-binding protein
MLAALLDAASAGWEYAADNPAEAIEILGRVSGVEVDVENETAGLEATVGYVFNDYTAEHGWGALDTSVWSAAIEIFEDYDMLDQPVSVDEAVNLSVLEAATGRAKRG